MTRAPEVKAGSVPRETPPVRVLVTGNKGLIGAVVATRLRDEGHDVVGYDRVKRDDILNVRALRRRMRACDAVVHSAALPTNQAGTPEEILAVNVTGTFNVLRAAEDIGAPVVYLSSVQALGLCEGRPGPQYLPLEYDVDPWRSLFDCSFAATSSDGSPSTAGPTGSALG